MFALLRKGTTNIIDYNEENSEFPMEDEKIYQYKPGYISTDSENIIYKKSKKKKDINSKKILIKQHILNNKKSITPLVKPNNPRINYGNKNKIRIISSKSYRNYNTEVIEE